MMTSKGLIVGGLISTVLLHSQAEQIGTSSTLIIATRASTTTSTLTPVAFNSNENSSLRKKNLEGGTEHETQQSQCTCENVTGGREGNHLYNSFYWYCYGGRFLVSSLVELMCSAVIDLAVLSSVQL